MGNLLIWFYPPLYYIGVKSFDVNLDSQTATVTTEPTVPYETVLTVIKKTGKAVTKGEADGSEMDT